MRVMVFPGQGSQKVGMGKALAESNAVAMATLNEISKTLGIDLKRIMWDSAEETLRQTENAQIALFATSVASFRAAESTDFQFAAGHSVGEYAALVCAGVLDLSDGARLVAKRGELMAHAGEVAPGTMAAVLGLEPDVVSQICAETPGTVVLANDNCPGQCVISGELQAVQAASDRLLAHGAKRVLPLNVSGAFHSPLMESSAAEMRTALDQVNFRTGDEAEPKVIPVVSNATAKPESAKWPYLLEQQLKSRVRWTESIRGLIAQGATEFVEFGSGEVLGGLIRRIDKSVSVSSFGS